MIAVPFDTSDVKTLAVLKADINSLLMDSFFTEDDDDPAVEAPTEARELAMSKTTNVNMMTVMYLEARSC